MPTYFEITKARVNDVTVATAMSIETGATLCRFVTRGKVNTPLELLETRATRDSAIRADRIGRLPRGLRATGATPMRSRCG